MKKKRRFFAVQHLFTGEEWLKDQVLLTEDDRILTIQPMQQLAEDWPLEDKIYHTVVPAFIDLQLYGAYGRLLAVHPDEESLKAIVRYSASGGAFLSMPTVATNTKDCFFRCIDAVRHYIQTGGSGIAGIHLEGPWIHPDKRGAHIEKLVHKPDEAEVTELLEYGRDVIRMITLAPERVAPAILNRIQEAGIIISAGHSNATYAQAIKAFDEGIPAVTHLYNAMSPLQHREPGLVGAAFENSRVMASIIPDGYHVSWPALRIAKKQMGERLFVITDAVTETSTGYYPHQLSGDKYEAGGVLSGSALTMLKAAQNLMQFAGVESGEAYRMCSLYPARVLGLEREYGRIAPGYKLPLLILGETGEMMGMIS